MPRQSAPPTRMRASSVTLAGMAQVG